VGAAGLIGRPALIPPGEPTPAAATPAPTPAVATPAATTPAGRRRTDWEAEARARLGAGAYDFFAAGAGEGLSVDEAVRAWRAWRLRPRVLVDVSSVDTSCTLLGHTLAAPLLVAPTAYHALAHEEGELASAAGAAEAGALYVMATRATRPLEEVAAVAGNPWWFQVYVLRDRGLTRALVERAVIAGASALVLTGDTPVVLPRSRTGATAGPRSRVRGEGSVLGVEADGWALRELLTDEQYLVNLQLHLPEAAGSVVSAATSQDPGITEEVIGWLGDLSGLPVLVKGALRADDALRCLAAGAAGIVVSNHGGRQLDGAISTAMALPSVVRAVREVSTAPVLVDGGIRDGRSAMTALALGASAVMVGRPVIWALAAGGQPAVTELLEGLRSELAEAMTLAGAPDLSALDRSLVVEAGLPPTGAGGHHGGHR
jgi:4-hydroxymandelate oxidase